MHLNEAEIENIEENQPKYFDALSSLNESIVEVKKQFEEVQKQIETTHSNHSDGIPLLRIKVCVKARTGFKRGDPESGISKCCDLE